MVRKTYWFAMFSMALIGALAFSAGISVAAPPADFLKATDTGMSTPEATAVATEAPGAMSTSSPSSGVLASPGATVQMSNVAKLGNILTDGAGLTLYVFKQDAPGTSKCTDACAQAWPPLTIDEGQEPVAGTGVGGALDFIDRSDGTYQVTYNDMPLYRFGGDKQPGDINGQGMLKGQWSVVTLTAAAPVAPAAPAAATPAAPAPQATSSY